jgi:small subunit ribosomal protein S20
MPIIESAKKRVRTTARQAEENNLHRSRARTSMKKIHDLLAAGKTADALAELPRTQSYLDKAAKVNAIHANAAARYKARLAAAFKTAGNKDKTPKRAIPAKTAKKAAPKKAAAKPAAEKK